MTRDEGLRAETMTLATAHRAATEALQHMQALGTAPGAADARARDGDPRIVRRAGSIYRRYAIVDAGVLQDAAARIDRAAGAGGRVKSHVRLGARVPIAHGHTSGHTPPI
jgi:hypothetical protein